MDALRALRDRTTSTRLLVLAHLHQHPHATLTEVAEHLGITVQAVSAHARAMAKEDLLSPHDGTYRPTAAGLQTLHEGVRMLRDAVSSLSSGLDTIRVTSAIAANRIRAGDDVGLMMAAGDLEARAHHPSPSRGKARADANPGEEVIVDQLQGVVPLVPGRLAVMTLPSPEEGGAARVPLPELVTRLGGPWDKTGALGTSAALVGRALVKRGYWRALDFEYASDRAAFNAAERGLSVVLLVTRDRLPEVLAVFEHLNDKTLRRVAVETLEAPRV